MAGVAKSPHTVPTCPVAGSVYTAQTLPVLARTEGVARAVVVVLGRHPQNSTRAVRGSRNGSIRRLRLTGVDFLVRIGEQGEAGRWDVVVYVPCKVFCVVKGVMACISCSPLKTVQLQQNRPNVLRVQRRRVRRTERR